MPSCTASAAIASGRNAATAFAYACERQHAVSGFTDTGIVCRNISKQVTTLGRIVCMSVCWSIYPFVFLSAFVFIHVSVGTCSHVCVGGGGEGRELSVCLSLPRMV